MPLTVVMTLMAVLMAPSVELIQSHASFAVHAAVCGQCENPSFLTLVKMSLNAWHSILQALASLRSDWLM